MHVFYHPKKYCSEERFFVQFWSDTSFTLNLRGIYIFFYAATATSYHHGLGFILETGSGRSVSMTRSDAERIQQSNAKPSSPLAFVFSEKSDLNSPVIMNLTNGATNKTVLDRFMRLDITASKKVNKVLHDSF